ncbi:MAG: POTRA domain-containing protein [Saprospiraceae bacterium]
MFQDSLSMMLFLGSVVADLGKDGYITANVDSIRCKSDTCQGYVFVGKQYKKLLLHIDSLSKEANLKFLPTNHNNLDQVNLVDWPVYAKNITSYFRMFGYPFCKVTLSEVQLLEDQLSASLIIDKGDYITYDSIIIKGDLNISKNFIYRYFQIKTGQPYDHSQIELLTRRTKNLLFARQKAEPQVVFNHNKATAYLHIDRIPVNKFDFILGILPNNNTTSGGKKWTISGDLKSEFYNRFGQGEYIFAQYKKLQPENQEIILKFSLPFVYNFAFGIDSDFRLFRNGNQHIDLFFTGGLQYLFNGLNNVKFGYHFKSSRLIDIDLERIKSTGKLPLNLDVIYRSGIAQIQILQTDYRFNPSRGWTMELKTNVGQKSILKNNQITGIEGLENIYESVQKPTLQFESEVDIQTFIPIKTYGAIRLRGMAGFKYNSKGILQNEFYRIGGSATLRGFDEESIWADRFFMISGEFRLFLDRNSFLSLPFFDMAFTRILVEENIVWDEAFGLGLGINFSTKAGIFNVSFASGSRLNSGFDFGNMKVHFGYVSLF